MRIRRGMTLVEVLATVAILAVALPPIMYGISVATGVAGMAKQRAEATSLAETKLDELVQAINEGQAPGMSGGFDEDHALYQWRAEQSNWDESYLTQLKVTVSWVSRNKNMDVTLSTLVYSGQGRTGGTTQ